MSRFVGQGPYDGPILIYNFRCLIICCITVAPRAGLNGGDVPSNGDTTDSLRRSFLCVMSRFVGQGP